MPFAPTLKFQPRTTTAVPKSTAKPFPVFEFVDEPSASQGKRVLTAGQAIEPDPQGKPQPVNVVTLLLNPQDSQKLQLASAQGNIQFVLRSGADQKSAELRATRLDELVLSDRPAPVVAAPGVKHAPRKATPASPIYLMEVIQGTQRSVQKF